MPVWAPRRPRNCQSSSFEWFADISTNACTNMYLVIGFLRSNLFQSTTQQMAGYRGIYTCDLWKGSLDFAHSQNMAFKSGEILQLTTPHLYHLFIAGMVVAIFYFLAPIFLRKWISDQNGNTLPPGPPVRYAFLRKYPELVLDYWAKKYGPLFSIWMGTQLFIVVSDPHIARDLLVTHGAVFSSRKRYFIKNQIILRGRAITASEYGDKW